jgi:hypothetical protein
LFLWHHFLIRMTHANQLLTKASISSSISLCYILNAQSTFLRYLVFLRITYEIVIFRPLYFSPVNIETMCFQRLVIEMQHLIQITVFPHIIFNNMRVRVHIHTHTQCTTWHLFQNPTNKKEILRRQNSKAISHQVPPASPLEISAGKYQRFVGWTRIISNQMGMHNR